MPSDEHIWALFRAALKLPREQWADFLAASTDDAPVRAEVLKLLNENAQTGGLLPPFVDPRPFRGPRPGDKIAEFEIIKLLGCGGMGCVFRARDSILERDIALKVLAAHLLDSEQAIGHFRHEAQAAARLDHPNIVAVHRHGEENDVHYIVMQYVEGSTLAAKLDQQRAVVAGQSVPGRGHGITFKAGIDEALRTIAALADALEYAHQPRDGKRVIHCDVKPGNILVDRAGNPRLTDFGIAKILTGDALAHSAEFVSPFYMSPEQARRRGTDIDHRTDIFSLGVVLYECLTLQRPFDGKTSQEVVTAITTREPRHPRALNPAISKDLQNVCLMALEKRPADRYPSAAHFAADLRCVLRGDPPLARPPSVLRLVRRYVSVHRVAAALGLILMLTLAAGTSGALAWRAHVRTLGVISIALAGSGAGAEVFAQTHDPMTGALGPAHALGHTPLRGLRLSAGLHRFTVVAADGTFADFDDYLLPSREVSLTVWLHSEPREARMVRFEAGEYVFTHHGIRSGVDETHTAALTGFLLDACEVSNAEYQRFLDDTGHSAPKDWVTVAEGDGLAGLPVVGIAQGDAVSYALWRGKRLPTLREWMAAAQVPGGQRYPWRGAHPAAAVPTCDVLRREQSLQFKEKMEPDENGGQPIDSHPECCTEAGLFHMFGNVKEFTGTAVPYRSLGDDSGAAVVMIAGSDWTCDPNFNDLTRCMMQPFASGSNRIGFRCARSISHSAKGAR